jgi:hypothetical protein
MENVEVRLRLPAERRATSVSLASPEREGDLDVPFKQEESTVSFTVPRLGIYEIAAVRMR